MTKRKRWSPAEEIDLARLYPDERAEDLAVVFGCSTIQIYRKANAMGLRKSEAFLLSQASGRTYDGRGRQFRFKAGQPSWNAGKKIGTRGRSGETQFKTGQRQGRAAENYQPIGAERIVDGYLQRKVNDDRPFYKRWKAVHAIVWEAANGPIPAGHAICFKDGNRLNVALENLELVTRAELQRRNTIHRYPPEMKDAMRLVGRIKREARKQQEATRG